jgi:hypothetical protein
MAQSINVQPNSFMRLPGNNSVLQLDRLEVADGATLWVPAAVTEMNVGELKLGREARITIVPGPTPFKLAVKQGELGSGSQISARGAAGSFEKPALPGRNLTLRLERLKADILAVTPVAAPVRLATVAWTVATARRRAAPGARRARAPMVTRGATAVKVLRVVR